MLVIVVEDYAALAWEAARWVARAVLEKPAAVLALPTGNTPGGLYKVLVQWGKEKVLDLSRVVIFNLDELLGLSRTHPCSFRAYMKEHLLSHVRVGAHHIMDSETDDPERECQGYEERIAAHEGIDLAVLGLGPNGHIAFNEPGTPFESRTHVAVLSPQTRRRLAPHFGGLEQVPVRALTMGIRTIMNAREILLLAAGEEKAAVVRDALLGPITPSLPASVLQLHPSLTVILDGGAASLLPVKIA